ncbi:hypothetical protein NM688_g5098 [Phlebia brevispora]|uniref:Uncharacterized protein n=1 Tax=Phlebia brevispora TaxID=194682 RepID=A0ACC1T0S9_9APHY|nr:hypothetical protein NM688_g5098 [Phlebia brevispora]
MTVRYEVPEYMQHPAWLGEAPDVIKPGGLNFARPDDVDQWIVKLQWLGDGRPAFGTGFFVNIPEVTAYDVILTAAHNLTNTKGQLSQNLLVHLPQLDQNPDPQMPPADPIPVPESQFRICDGYLVRPDPGTDWGAIVLPRNGQHARPGFGFSLRLAFFEDLKGDVFVSGYRVTAGKWQAIESSHSTLLFCLYFTFHLCTLFRRILSASGSPAPLYSFLAALLLPFSPCKVSSSSSSSSPTHSSSPSCLASLSPSTHPEAPSSARPAFRSPVLPPITSSSQSYDHLFTLYYFDEMPPILRTPPKVMIDREVLPGCMFPGDNPSVGRRMRSCSEPEGLGSFDMWPRPGRVWWLRIYIMSTSIASSHSLTDVVSSTICSSQSIPPVSDPVIQSSPSMKDVSNSVRAPRPTMYPKKRPSPHGVSKSRKQSPLYPAQAVVRKSPRAAKTDMLLQRQREAHIVAMRRDGIYLEDEYRDEIRFYMHEMEPRWTNNLKSGGICAPALVDFLVEIHFTFRLRPETLYLTLNIIDRYVSRRIVYVKHYQLVGCAALWIAAKFEDAKERVPTVQDLTQICRDTYDESAFIQMEGHVLSTIQWTLGHPTAEAWLRMYCVGPASMEDMKVQHVARFLMEITLFYREFVEFPPSAIALGALTLARHICGKSSRGLEETEESQEIVDLLDIRLAKHVNDLSETLVKKYSYAFYSKAATSVVQYYLEGGRYQRQSVLPALPMTPVKSYPPRARTPASVSTTASDLSDDMPATPTSPIYASDAFSTPYVSDDKENVPSSPSSIVAKLHMEAVPEQFLPHDFVTISRPALHNHNGLSPRPIAVVA